jgi:hypothetical protein
VRTFVAGAYRTAVGGVQTATVETFRFAVEDVLLGGQGWSFSGMREDAAGSIRVTARGEWDHHLAPGNWQLIRPTELRLVSTLTTASGSHVLDARPQGPLLRIDLDGDVRTVEVPTGTELSIPLHAFTGPTIRRLARAHDHGSDPVVATFDPDQHDGVRFGQGAVAPVGRATIVTPEGEVTGTGFRWLGEVPAETDALYLLGRDGLLNAAEIGTTTVWRIPG